MCRHFIYFLALLLLCSSCAVSQKVSSNSALEKRRIQVLSTTAMIDALVANIGGDRIEHSTLVVGQLDPHRYDLVKGDGDKIEQADLVIANGLNLEHGASLCYQLQKHRNTLFLANAIAQKVPDRILLWNQEVDPHLWMDISLWAEGITPIVERLSVIDPQGALIYEDNGKRLYESLMEAHRATFEQMQQVRPKYRYLVTSHDAFRYFTRAYLQENGDWENRCVAPEGLAPEGQLSTQDIRRVVTHLVTFSIHVIFGEANVNQHALKKIIEACLNQGLRVYLSKAPLYGDSMGDRNALAGGYPGMVIYDANIMRQEWERFDG